MGRKITRIVETSIGETPFNLIYGTGAMIPVEVGEPTLQRKIEDLGINDECLRRDLNLLQELREK